MAACDTYRAAAVEQLSIWAERIGVQIVKHKMGSDPAAVAFDACKAADSRSADFLILDTAGRLHTQKDLMRQLTKIRDVVSPENCRCTSRGFACPRCHYRPKRHFAGETLHRSNKCHRDFFGQT